MGIAYTIGVRLNCEGVRFFGPGPARLLRLVAETHSLHKAAGVMKMSYTKAWHIVNDIEKALGKPVLVRTRGGRDGGGSTLTKDGEALLRAYDGFVQAIEDAGQSAYNTYFGGK